MNTRRILTTRIEDNDLNDGLPPWSVHVPEVQKVPPNVQDGGSPMRIHFYSLRAKGTKPDDDYDDAAKL